MSDLQKSSLTINYTIVVTYLEAQYQNPLVPSETVKILTEGQFDSVGRFEDDPLTEHKANMVIDTP